MIPAFRYNYIHTYSHWKTCWSVIESFKMLWWGATRTECYERILKWTIDETLFQVCFRSYIAFGRINWIAQHLNYNAIECIIFSLWEHQLESHHYRLASGILRMKINCKHHSVRTRDGCEQIFISANDQLGKKTPLQQAPTLISHFQRFHMAHSKELILSRLHPRWRNSSVK